MDDPQMYDMATKNGQVIDGTGTLAFQSDVAINNGKIVKVEPAIIGDAETRIHAPNLIASPGFVDMHSHREATSQHRAVVRRGAKVKRFCPYSPMVTPSPAIIPANGVTTWAIAS